MLRQRRVSARWVFFASRRPFPVTLKILLGPPTTLRGGVAKPGVDQALVLQALEGGVDAGDGDLVAGFGLQFLGDRHPVGVLPEVHDRYIKNPELRPIGIMLVGTEKVA